jgi:hypothetical protein
MVNPQTEGQTLRPQHALEAERPLSRTHAFVVQFREQSDANAGFTGRVEHIISGRAARFESAEELLAFFRRELSAVQTRHSEER